MKGFDLAQLAGLFSGVPLPEPQESRYRLWALFNDIPQSNDYDMRGFYKGLMSLDSDAGSAINPNDNQMHFPDKWKLPNHPSFSTDSKYYDAAKMPGTPSWFGGNLPNGGASWALRRPDGSPVMQEAPWWVNGILGTK